MEQPTLVSITSVNHDDSLIAVDETGQVWHGKVLHNVDRFGHYDHSGGFHIDWPPLTSVFLNVGKG